MLRLRSTIYDVINPPAVGGIGLFHSSLKSCAGVVSYLPRQAAAVWQAIPRSQGQKPGTDCL